MKVLVTGGAGFIGSNLANTLANLDAKARGKKNTENNDNNVIALDDLSLGSPSNLSENVKFVKGSVMNYDLILELSKGCEFVFHQAALSSSPMFAEDPREGLEVNVLGFMNIMEAAKRNKVKKVVYASSSSLYNGLPTPFIESTKITPRTFYESSFYCREVMARTYYYEHGINSTGLRYFSVYGPNEKHKGRFANNISQFIWDMSEKKSPVIYGNGSQTRDFTFVEDVVQANILAMTKQPRQPVNYGDERDYINRENPHIFASNSANLYGRNSVDNTCGGCPVYNIGTGTQTSFNQVIDIINQHLGTDIQPIYTHNPINNYVQDTRADISLARLELGYEPKWKAVEDGIKQLLLYINSRNVR